MHAEWFPYPFSLVFTTNTHLKTQCVKPDWACEKRIDIIVSFAAKI